LKTGKVRIPYAAFELMQDFNSYAIFNAIWKDLPVRG